MLGQRFGGRIEAGLLWQYGIVDPAFELVDNDLVLFEVGVVVALVADAVVLV